jgi:hypothetical protein
MFAETEHSRQVRLPEVGEDGQRRLAGGGATIAAGDGALMELSYLERAGVGAVRIDAARSPSPFRHASAFRHSGPRELGAGAWRALRGIVALLEKTTS